MDIFFSASFTSVYKESLLETDDVYYPFLLIDKDGIRSMSSIGYQGPFFKNSFSKAKAESFIRAKNEYCLNSGITAEFIRYNPFLQNDMHFHDVMPVTDAATFYAVELNRSFEDYLKSRPSRTRSSYERSSKLEIDISFKFKSKLLERAISMGNEFISDVQSAEKLLDSGLAVIVSSYYSGEEAASSLFFLNDESSYYILNYSSDDGKSHGANVGIIMEFYKYALKRGIKYIGLGGGVDDGDSLSLFKKQFATSLSTTRHSKIIHDYSVFEKRNDGSIKYFPSWLKGYFPFKIS